MGKIYSKIEKEFINEVIYFYENENITSRSLYRFTRRFLCDRGIVFVILKHDEKILIKTDISVIYKKHRFKRWLYEKLYKGRQPSIENKYYSYNTKLILYQRNIIFIVFNLLDAMYSESYLLPTIKTLSDIEIKDEQIYDYNNLLDKDGLMRDYCVIGSKYSILQELFCRDFVIDVNKLKSIL